MEKTKVVFIGAGVGNLLAANYLHEHLGNDFLILEKGSAQDERNCPGARNAHCLNCTVCQTASGTGGANALNGNKLCHFPASRSVVDFGGEELEPPAMNYIRSFSRAITENARSERTTTSAFKYYHSDIFTRSDFAELIRNLSREIKNRIRNNEEVIGIRCLEKSVIVETHRNIYEAERIVFGTGRSSYRFLADFLSDNGFAYERLSQDIGIRVEGPRELFSETYYYQVDPKLKFSYPEGSGRTFCAHNQGKVVPVQLGSSSYADGAFGDFSTGLNNIALMVRTSAPLSIDKLEHWAKEMNRQAKGNLFMGEVSMSEPRKAMLQILELIKQFPTSNHARLFERLLRDLFIGEHAIFRFDATAPLTMKVYAPAIDRYWIRPALNRDFSLKGNGNIYVIGDAAGLSRGFLQAMFTGYAWARAFVEKMLENSDNHDKIRCSGVPSGLFGDAIQER